MHDGHTPRPLQEKATTNPVLPAVQRPGALVFFMPEGAGRTSRAITDAEGRYEPASLRDIMEADIGRHAVRITTITDANGGKERFHEGRGRRLTRVRWPSTIFHPPRERLMACLTFRRETNCVPPLRRSPGRSLRVCATLIAFVLSTDALSVASASPPEEAAAAGEIDDRLRTLVGDLGYEAEVGDLCCQFVADWNLSSWKQRIDAARRMEAEGRIKSAKVAGVQSQVLDELRGRLRATIQQADGMSEYFHLRSVFTSRKSQCVGNMQLLLVLGAAIGLDVRCLDVLYPPHGTLGEHMYHSASIVRLADGRVRMVDERWGVDSPAFVFTDHYARHVIYWRLIDESNPLVLHRQVRPVDLQMVHGDMLVSLSTGYSKAERYDDADLWFNVAMSRADQGKVRESLDAYTQAVPMLARWRHEVREPVEKLKRRELDDAVGPRLTSWRPESLNHW